MFSKLIRLTRDAELRTLPNNGTEILQVSGVYDVGFGDKKVAQFVDFTIWGKKATEKVAQYLTKGTQIVVTVKDLKANAYINKKTGEPVGTLKGDIVEFEFSSAPKEQSQTPAQQQAPMDDDFSNDIPFAYIGMEGFA